MPDDHASSREQETAARRVRVLLPLPLREALDYLAPEGTSPPEPGSFVNVPLGQRSLAGSVRDGGGGGRDLIGGGREEERFASAEAPESPSPDWRLCGPALSPDQSIAAQRLVSSVEAGAFRVTVLDGVTGSGKTETYFAALAAALAAGRQVLVLLPEIALGAQWLERFRRRFGALPEQWHSDMTAAERRDTWRAVAAGRARVVVGARSALFLPFPELGLIVADEEDDPSTNQDDRLIYHTP